MVFGATDISRRFHPVAFMITSHEQEEDFVYFFKSLLEIAVKCNVDLLINYIVQDACRACYNAVEKVFPENKIIMCWFHLKYNVKKRKSLIPENYYDDVMRDLKLLHMSYSESKYNETLTKVSKRWDKLKLDEFKSYFFLAVDK